MSVVKQPSHPGQNVNSSLPANPGTRRPQKPGGVRARPSSRHLQLLAGSHRNHTHTHEQADKHQLPFCLSLSLLTISRPCLAFSSTLSVARSSFLPLLPLSLSATHLCRKKGALAAQEAPSHHQPARAPSPPERTKASPPPPPPTRPERRDKATRQPVLPALRVPLPGCPHKVPKPPSSLSLSLQGVCPYVRTRRRSCASDMSSAAGGGYGGGGGAEHHHHHQHLLFGQAAPGQLYHVPQHSRREKLRFPPDPADSSSSPPMAWPAVAAPPFYHSYASSSTSSYSPHSPLPHAQLVAHALPAGAGAQIPSQSFALSLSSASSNPPPPPPPQPRRQQQQQLAAAGVVATGPYGPFTGYAAVLGKSRFLGPAQKLLEEICDVGGRPPSQVGRRSDDALLGMDAMDHDMDGGSERAAAEAVAVSGAEQQWRKTRLISLMEDPMVEEIHNLEMRQQHKNPSSLDKNNQLGMQQTHQHSSDSSGKPSDPSSSQRGQSSINGMTTRNLNSPASSSRHIQDELAHQMPHDMPGQVSFAYNGLAAHHALALSHPHQQAEAVSAGVGVGGNGGVSLTLGLHQNNRNYLAEPLPAALPLNLAHRFGLEDVSDAYVMGSFGGQDRHFTKEIGGHHLVHDFVG
ncbi:hypothetical protein HU200_031969 [Digitaria exilis]|uniref:POX domain-containing protein n=1 Tax=Digitaria exilis TaxID=1010633 RepID=A0A835BLG0_9POAL|nr:hypothetical protein HU200_031969 [Digitaria exilis]